MTNSFEKATEIVNKIDELIFHYHVFVTDRSYENQNRMFQTKIELTNILANILGEI